MGRSVTAEVCSSCMCQGQWHHRVTESPSSFFNFWWCHVSLGTLVPQPGIEISSWQWKRQVLTTGPPLNSQELKFYFPKAVLDNTSLCPGPEMVIRHSFCVAFYLLWAGKYRWDGSLKFLRPQYKPSFWDDNISSVYHRTYGSWDYQRYRITATGETMSLECHQTDNHDCMYWSQ